MFILKKSFNTVEILPEYPISKIKFSFSQKILSKYLFLKSFKENFSSSKKISLSAQ